MLSVKANTPAEAISDRTRLILTVSREAADGCARGRVTDHLASLAPASPSTHFYLCGLDAMVDEVSYRLRDRGVPSDHVHAEVFFGPAT